MIDTVVIGGGPAGLSAALLLGRSRRSVLMLDDDQARNLVSHASHSFLTRDGTPPHELRRIGREQLATYPSVTVRADRAADVAATDGGFLVSVDDGESVKSRTIVIATGVRDLLPTIDGLDAIWGTSAFSCPYCDGWEVRDQPLGVIASGEAARHLVPLVRQWSRDLVLLTDGPADLGPDDRALLAALDVPIHEAPIARLEQRGGALEQVVLASGEALPRSALFVRTTSLPRTDLAVKLGCELVDLGPIAGLIKVDESGQTTVPGVYAAGDVTAQMPQIAFAVAAGTRVGTMINAALVNQDLPQTRADDHAA
jgi:thioredoxin reductase